MKKELTKEQRFKKTQLQKERRDKLKAAGVDINAYKRLSEDQKEINKKLKLEKQQMWFASLEGQAFKERQANRLKKYSSERDRSDARNLKRRQQLKTDLDANLKNRINACKCRAKKKNIPFNIDFKYIKSIYSDTCPYLGIKLNLRASSGNSMDALSIDKIIPELGYVKGNVQIISYKANVMKQDVSLDDLRKFSKRALELHGDI